MEYLSGEWLEAMARAVAHCVLVGDDDRPPSVVLEIVVSDAPGPEGVHEVRYHLCLDGRSATLVRGAAADPTVRMSQRYRTAVEIATGRRSAQQAFLAGDLRIGGDTTALVTARPALAALDDATAEVRARTHFPPVGPPTA